MSSTSELVKVIVRCRPRNEKEEKLKCQVRERGGGKFINEMFNQIN